MSKKKPVKKKSNKQTPEKTIQYAALAIVVIGVLVVLFSFLSKSQNKGTDTPVAASGSAASSSPACGIFDSIAAADQYDSAPPQLVDQAKQYFATYKMANGGQFVVELYPAKAPITVNSFVFLTCKGFFNGLTFHRVKEGFMAQGGDPTGTGRGGPGYQFVNEYSDLVFDKAGVLAMANAGPDTNGSQFFITFGPTKQLNGSYTIFGQVVEGMDVVNAITRRDPQKNPSFTGDAIETITITEK
jgi:cyclophilin family peptidyl-prolyl cis-trans isomerase